MQAKMNAGILRRYRWKELGLLIIPFLILLLEMAQLPLAQHFQSQIIATANTQQPIPFSTAILPSLRDLIPVFGLIIALILVNLILSIFFPKADQLLLPLVGLMSGLGVLMALRLGPDVG
ncbi:MAG TPA: FtsW/RodA/SpoVE family cell cycle protein, partial [Ktedonobacteraceae bacterium]